MLRENYFFSLLLKRLEDHLIKKNRLIDLPIQKGYMANGPGCCEHMSLVWKELKAAKTNKLNLAAVCLDIINVYYTVKCLSLPFCNRLKPFETVHPQLNHGHVCQ